MTQCPRHRPASTLTARRAHPPPAQRARVRRSRVDLARRPVLTARSGPVFPVGHGLRLGLAAVSLVSRAVRARPYRFHNVAS